MLITRTTSSSIQKTEKTEKTEKTVNTETIELKPLIPLKLKLTDDQSLLYYSNLVLDDEKIHN